jgi:hypothetical protein
LLYDFRLHPDEQNEQLIIYRIDNQNMATKIKFPRPQLSSGMRLWLSAIISGLIYLAFTLPFPLSRYFAVNPPVDYTKLTSYSIFGFVAYLIGILSLFGLYLNGIRSLTDKNLGMDRNSAMFFVLMSGIIFGLILIFSYPQTAIDLFVYALRTRGWALYGLSPFSTTPESVLSSDPWLGLAGEWADAASPYGPIWEWLSLVAYHLSGGQYLGHLFALKVISFAAYLGSAWMVYQILRLIRPRWAVVGLTFFAWNPLVLLESVQNAHNDIVMVFFLLLMIWAYVRLMNAKRQTWGLILTFIGAFALSILVKFVTLLTLPFLLLSLAWRQPTWIKRFSILAFYGLAILAIVIVVMAPFWPGLENWAVIRASKGAGRSLFAFLVLTLIPRVNTATAFDITTAIIYAIFGSIYLWSLWRVIRTNQQSSIASEQAIEAPILGSFYVFWGYALIVATVFHAWYLLWFMPLAALLVPAKRPISGALIFSLAALLIIPYYETIRVWIPYLNQNHWLGHLIGVGLLIPPVLFSLWKPARLIPMDATRHQGRGRT